MSYNTRRVASGHPNSAAVGQRRPGPGGPVQPLLNNFTSGGSINPANKPFVQANQGQQFAAGGQQRAQQQQQPSFQTPAVQRQQQTPQPQAKPDAPKPDVVKAEVPQTPMLVASDPADPNNANGEEIKDELLMEDGEVPQKKKPHWMRTGSRINKKERIRRRNERLRKILQPKNALMILNELIGGATYDVAETPDPFGSAQFRCLVTVEGKEHTGSGKSKPLAKNAAAEAALKSLVLSKFKTLFSGEEAPEPASAETEEKMEGVEENVPESVSWTHVASYALHKLLSEWDDGGCLPDNISLASLASSPSRFKTSEKRPAKKLPVTAATMNPIMLLNQMHPNAVYEDVDKKGNPPHVFFTVKCTVNEQVFFGNGSNKKAARKLCAFSACMKVLGMNYSPSFLEEHGVFIDETGNIQYVVKAEEETVA